jgi:hypothetical protein
VSPSKLEITNDIRRSESGEAWVETAITNREGSIVNPLVPIP